MGSLRRLALLIGLGSLAACGSATSGSGSGGGAGGSGGAGGGGAASTRLSYKVTKVSGTYGGSGQSMQSMTWTDTLAHNTCTYTSPGSTASQDLYVDIAKKDWAHGLSVSGTFSCPMGSATSTTRPACTTTAVTSTGIFQWLTDVTAWDDEALMTFKVTAFPSGIPSCNYGVVISDQSYGIQGTTRLGNFRGTAPFDVHFTGTKSLTRMSETSVVDWDFTATFQPTP